MKRLHSVLALNRAFVHIVRAVGYVKIVIKVKKQHMSFCVEQVIFIHTNIKL